MIVAASAGEPHQHHARDGRTMYSETATIELETCAATGRHRPNMPSLRGPWPSGTRRVFWAVEQSEDDLDAAETQQADAASGLIEITLADGIRVRVDNQVDSIALRRVLDALQGRQAAE